MVDTLLKINYECHNSAVDVTFFWVMGKLQHDLQKDLTMVYYAKQEANMKPSAS